MNLNYHIHLLSKWENNKLMEFVANFQLLYICVLGAYDQKEAYLFYFYVCIHLPVLYILIPLYLLIDRQNYSNRGDVYRNIRGFSIHIAFTISKVKLRS